MADREAAGNFSDAALTATILDDVAQLTALVRELGLVRYASWLPRMLHWEFHRAMEEFDANAPVDLDISVPGGLAWATRGKKPKQRAGSMGGYRLEHLERVIELFYRGEVKREPKKRIAINDGIARSDVQHAVRRARALPRSRLFDSPLTHRKRDAADQENSKRVYFLV